MRCEFHPEALAEFEAAARFYRERQPGLETIETDHLLIIAVMHCRRQPGYWRHRPSHA
jgi:hypothetical protein